VLADLDEAPRAQHIVGDLRAEAAAATFARTLPTNISKTSLEDEIARAAIFTTGKVRPS
jgi:hypothetical protein